MPYPVLFLNLHASPGKQGGDTLSAQKATKAKKLRSLLPVPTLPTPNQWFSELPFSARRIPVDEMPKKSL